MTLYLDDIQDDLYRRVPLAGDAAVEADALRPVTPMTAAIATPSSEPVDESRISLAGGWLLKGAAPLSGDVSMVAWPSTWMQIPGGAQPQWWRPETDRSDWLPVTVPTTVQHALLEAGLLPDPMWNANTYDEITATQSPEGWPWPFRRTQVEQQEWWFARRFTVPSEWSGQELELHFEGLDYSGSVFLNGYPLGHHEGMFGGPTHRVSEIIRFDEENELVVRVDPPPLHWYGKPKGCGGFGWHYGHLITTGLWRDVTVRTVPAVDVRNLFVSTRELVPGSHASVVVQVDVDNRTGTSQHLELRGTIRRPEFVDPVDFAGEVELAPGQSRHALEVAVENPAVWWPHGYGSQPLHELLVTPHVGVGADATPVPTLRTTFGIRTVEMRPLANWSGPDHYKWQFTVNGVPMFIKGANWCWTDPLLDGQQDKYERILELTRRGGIQMLRVWGAGNIEDDYFYEICDRKGILTYQEFPLSWGPPDSPHADLAVIDQQVQVVVERLRNHPSLIMWGGGNENHDPVGADEVLFLIGRRCRQFDPSRPYHRSDPWGGSEHNYIVYHGGQPIDEGYQRMAPALYGEFGCPSLPDRESVLNYLPEETLDVWPPAADNGGVLMHQPQFGLFDFVKQLRYADYGPVRSWDDMIKYSQFAQGDALRFAAEMMRADSPEQTAGFWFYKMTDLFPGNSWAIIDFYGEPKTSYYRAKQVCRPTSAYLRYRHLTVPDTEPFTTQIWAANDTAQDQAEMHVVTTVYGSELTVLGHTSVAVDLAVSERRQVDHLEVPAVAHQGKIFLISTRLTDHEGSLVTDQWYWINAKIKTENVKEIEGRDLKSLGELDAPSIIAAYAEQHPAPLLELPRTKLEYTLTGGTPGTIEIHNTGDVPAFNVTIRGLDRGPGAYLEDNSFCLHPGESRRIAFEEPLAAPSRRVEVSAWNAKAEPLE